MSFQTFVTERLTAITAQLNAIVTNAKKIEELPIQDILDVNSKIHVSKAGVSQSLTVKKIIDSVSNTFNNQLIFFGEITILNNTLTIPAPAQWKINNIIYTTTDSTIIPIEFSAIGFIRTDILVANTLGEIVLITGNETSGIAIRPNIPNDTILVTEINVTEEVLSTDGPPINTDLVNYRQKLEKQEIFIDGQGETTVPELISASYRIMSGFTSITGIVKNLNFNYLGREFTFVNFQATPITIVHGAQADGVLNFDLLSATDIILTKGQMAKFKFCKRDGQYVLELVSKNFELGGSSGIYNGSSPTTFGISGIPIGTDISDLPVNTILERILCPYIAPSVFSFFSSAIPTVVESGTTISGTKAFQMQFSELANITPNSLAIFNENLGTTVANNLAVTSPQSVAIGTIQLNGNGTSQSWKARINDTNNFFFSNLFTANSYYKQFFGNVSAFPTNSAEARALSNNSYSYNNSFSIVISSTKFSIAIPATKSLVSVITANNENITSSFVLSNMNVNDAGGNAVAYKIYNFSSAVALDTNVTINVQ